MLRGVLGSRAWTALVFFGLPAFVHALIATKGTLNFLQPDYGWVFYNQYALALADGRFSIPAEAIGPEGFFVNGHVYGYYGLMPAVLRLPFIAFLDLRHTPLAVLMNWSMTVAGAAALQAAALGAFRWRAQAQAMPPVWPLLLASASIWFFSGAILVIQNASFYHEPFAAALLMSGLFTLVSVRVLLQHGGAPHPGHLAALAALAGACIFARQTTAIGLYAACLAWVAVSGLQMIRAKGLGLSALVAWTLRYATAPGLILLLAGIVYLATNAVRFGSAGASFPIDTYGYLLMVPDDARLLNIRNEGQFHWARVAPNALFALIGGDELRQKLIAAAGGGPTAALGTVIRLGLAWTPSILLSLLSLIWLAGQARHTVIARIALLLVLCLSIGAALQLSYATASYRYYADLWPPVGFMVVLSAALPARLPPDFAQRAAGWAGLVSFLVSGAYMTYMTLRPIAYEDNSLNRPLPKVLVERATAPGARDPGLPGGTPPGADPGALR